MDYIKKEDLVFGETYKCEARNFVYGIWMDGKFQYMRTKFGLVFTDYEYHYDDGPPHGTVKPIEKHF